MSDEEKPEAGADSSESQVFAATRKPAPPPVEVLESSAASEVIEEMPSYVARGLVYLLLFLVVAAGLYSYFGKTDDAIKATGTVIPQGEAAVVQSFKPGRLAAVRVKEGDVVKEGQVLAELDVTTSRLERAKMVPERIKLEKEYECARQAVKVLKASVVGNQVRVDENQLTGLCSSEEADAVIALKRAQIDYESTLWSAKHVTTPQVKSHMSTAKNKEQTIALRRLQLEDARRDLARAKAQLDTYREMTRRGLSSPVRLLEEQKKHEEAVAKVKDAEVSLHAAEIELEEVALRVTSTNAQLDNAMVRAKEQFEHALLKHQAAVKSQEKRLYQFELQLTQFNAEQKLQDFVGQLDRLTAPVAGTITGVRFKTAGEVVRPGETFFTINPAGRPLVAKVAVPNRSIGQLKVGMPAKLKFDAYPFQNYGSVAGRVLEIAPDARQTKDDLVFDATISVDKGHVVKAGKRYPIFPGLTLAAEIVIERRRIIDVFLDPFKKLTED